MIIGKTQVDCKAHNIKAKQSAVAEAVLSLPNQMITVLSEKGEPMAENYKHLYEQTKNMLTMYQDNLIPGFRQKIYELEADNERLRKGWAEAVSAHSKADSLIRCDGYMAFRGTMKIQPKTAAVPSYELYGDWLYKPETDCWYGNGRSFPEDICTIVEVGTKKLIEWKEDLICGGFAEEWAYVCPVCGCKISDKSGLGLGEYTRSNQRLNLCPNCGSITKKEARK